MTIIPLAPDYSDSLWAFNELMRRAVDGTINPFFVDTVNKRIIIGGTSSMGNGSPLQVQSGDIEVTTAGNGFVVPNRAGTHRYRILIENDGALTVDQVS